ncbi:ferrous iron transport protein B [Orenia metallireducens]|uniref:Ferrous iron transport protein B n=1 Tax=Orenia metallireducens TaxID=1413210 RepID=A0A285I591_9FIRM|nr:ferrous iron transport protein B [Orenia metallireducens]PRX19715.1 ferrous iron transport protein B [Orenia metallireducens]SNY43104.1 ferrous iron transport protein B [Orenia metallireducens]
MDCCNISHQIDIPEGAKKIVLAGNPNVGKSIFFNSFTGIYVDVSNYPGTTLDISSGKYKDDVVIDTPGVYGVSSFNDEEIVARDVIASADVVVNIVDAVHLERDLFLTQQIIDMGIPVLVALNMMDEAQKSGLEINVDTLSQKLGVPVIPTTAIRGDGLSEVKEAVWTAKVGNSSLKLEDELEDVKFKGASRSESLLILEGDPHVAEKYSTEPLEYRETIYRDRRERVNEIVDKVVTETNEGTSLRTTIGRLMLRPITGIPMLLLALYALYQFVGVFIAQTIVGITEETIFINTYEPFIRGVIHNIVEPGSLTSQLLVGEFGLLTMAITYTFGLLLPLVVGFYFFLAILEDSGYLPRIAALVDRMLTSLGLNGRAVIPMLLGFGCVTMATITTRLLGSKRERIIAVFLLGLAIPCSAQLGVIAGLIAPLGAKFFIVYVAAIFAVYVLAGTFLNKILPGESTDLLIDLPPLRLPRLSNVMQKTFIKSKSFIKEAGPIFAVGAVAITLMQDFGILEAIQNAVAPITVGWLELPKETATAFIMGIVRRDFGAAGLTDLAMTPAQTTVALITITLFVPCIAAMLIMIKERSWKESIYIWFGSWITAFVTGGIVAKILSLF